MTPETRTELLEAVHRAICEDSLEDCYEWRGQCVKAVDAVCPIINRTPTPPTP